MTENMIEYLQKKLQIDRYDLLKVIFSGLAYFFVIGAYSILRSFKTSIFLAFVGREYEPYAKIIGIIITIPVILLYAKIIDRLQKHQAVFLFLGFYAILTVLFALVFIHPVYGIPNTQASPWRMLGWLFEIFMDLFQALIVGTFWSFVSSISTPDFAGKHYSKLVIFSRIGGMFTTVLSWMILEHAYLTPAFSISLPLLIGALFLVGACYSIYYLKKLIPQSHLHGYEAAYLIDQKNEKAHKKTGILDGLRLIIAEPYLLGIFWLVFSFEVINIIFDYQLHVLMSIETNNHVLEMSKFMLLYTLSFQVLGLVFAFFGTSQIKRFGVKACLLVMPATTIIMAMLPIAYPHLLTLWIVQVVLRALNYSFNQPLREMLFIPAVKDIQFTSKAWIDSFGRTISKTSGSALNVFAVQASYLVIVCQSVFAIGLAVAWGFAAVLVGKKYIKTITNNEVIGKNT